MGNIRDVMRGKEGREKRDGEVMARWVRKEERE